MCGVREDSPDSSQGPSASLHFKQEYLRSHSRKTHRRGLPLSQLTICSQMLVVRTWFFSSFKEKERIINTVYMVYKRRIDTIIHAGIILLGLWECMETRRHQALQNTLKHHLPSIKLFSLF